jgi:prepilin-type N-terminal cleavage/methylation domain-containing protein
VRCVDGGFTLIEVIIAVVVLAITIPPVFWALRNANVQRSTCRERGGSSTRR